MLNTFLMRCFSVCILLVFFAANTCLALEAGPDLFRSEDIGSEDVRVVFGKIVSVIIGSETEPPSVKIDNEIYSLSPDVKIYDNNKNRCNIKMLTVPFSARVLILPDEKGKYFVIEIRPHEE